MVIIKSNMLTEETMVLMVTIVNIEMRKAIIIVVVNTTGNKRRKNWRVQIYDS